MKRVGSAFGYSLLLAIDWALAALQWFIFIWVILSWVVFFTAQTSFRWRHRGLFHFLFQLNEIFSRFCDPILRPFRRLLPPWRTGGIDWSPLILLLLIYFLRTFLRLAFW